MTRTTALRRSFPTVRLIVAPFRWIGQSRRRIWCAALVLLTIIASPPLWWATQLWGLPDIGDPFDVAAFRASTIPEERNAFVLYEQAAALLKPSAKYFAKSSGKIDWLARWSQAHPDLRRWVEDNREALAVYHRGAERPDALPRAVGLDRENLIAIGQLSLIHQMVLLEASRLEEQGDAAAAWESYRALLRTVHHLAMHGDAYRRRVLLQWRHQIRVRLTEWSADQHTTPALLRQAIREIVACEALAPSETDTLKASYLDAIALLQSPNNPGHQVPLGRFRGLWNPDFQLTPEQIQSLWDWWRFWRHEPERSRRVIRLVTANWLASLDVAVAKRSKPEPKAAIELYRFGPESPANARALAPEDLDAWFDTAYDAQQVLQYLDASGTRDLEAADHSELLLLLASELYRREHGTDPPSDEALVGPYLRTLPTCAAPANQQSIRKTGKPQD
jgi:hypothetical protein